MEVIWTVKKFAELQWALSTEWKNTYFYVLLHWDFEEGSYVYFWPTTCIVFFSFLYSIETSEGFNPLTRNKNIFLQNISLLNKDNLQYLNLVLKFLKDLDFEFRKFHASFMSEQKF